MLLKEEKTITKKIKIMESDKRLLEREQDSIINRIKTLEKEKKDFKNQEREFIKTITKLETIKRATEEKITKIESKNIMLTKKESELQSELKRVKVLVKKVDNLKEMEKTHDRLKVRLRKMYKEIEETAQKTRKTRRATPKVVYKPYKTRVLPKADIQDFAVLLGQTRNLIRNKRFTEANQNINNLMNRYTSIHDDHPRKREIYYEILGLKNDVKLGLL